MVLPEVEDPSAGTGKETGRVPVNRPVFGPLEVIPPEKWYGGQVWDVATEHPVDKYGNVYLTYDEGVTALTSTARGLGSHGTMPGAENPKYPFQRAGLRLDATGEPMVIQRCVDHAGRQTGGEALWAWQNGRLMALEEPSAGAHGATRTPARKRPLQATEASSPTASQTEAAAASSPPRRPRAERPAPAPRCPQ
ncbi:hypothetical protein [Kocuria tytonis]|uniref:hypothetical protein n=1 Tax=Kocuria tytonis TaxID=2054280 RepID=UPI0018F5351A|nr:hypothetical protein [Kocuria tytonis]